MALEHLLTTDEFNKPKVVDGKDAIAKKLLTLLTMNPGTDMLHPEMGVGIVNRYRYADKDDLSDLQKEIDDQIAVYLPIYSAVSVSVSYQEGLIKTSISIDDTLYTFSSNDSEVYIGTTDDIRGGEDILNPDSENPMEDGYTNAEVYEDPFAGIPFFNGADSPSSDSE